MRSARTATTSSCGKGVTEESLVRHLEALFHAISVKDLAGIERSYLNEPSLLVFVEGPRYRNVGWNSIKHGWRTFLDAPLELKNFEWGSDRLVEVSADGEMGFVAATNRYSWLISGRPHVTEMRGTWIARSLAGAWRIVHEHGSFPAADPYGIGDWVPKT